MSFATIGIRLLETLFFAGMAGSAVVVVISFVEDSKDLLGKERYDAIGEDGLRHGAQTR